MVASVARCARTCTCECRACDSWRHCSRAVTLLTKCYCGSALFSCRLTSLSSLAAENRFDHVLVESSGISEPLPVAETFTFQEEATGVGLNDVASLVRADGSNYAPACGEYCRRNSAHSLQPAAHAPCRVFDPPTYSIHPHTHARSTIS